MNIMQFIANNRLVFALIATTLFSWWIYLISRQFMPLFMLVLIIISILSVTYNFRRWITGIDNWKALVFGACVGYLSSIFAVAVVIFFIYGFNGFFSRFYPSSLYVYPTASLAWLYGLVVVALQRVDRGGENGMK